MSSGHGMLTELAQCGLDCKLVISQTRCLTLAIQTLLLRQDVRGQRLSIDFIGEAVTMCHSRKFQDLPGRMV